MVVAPFGYPESREGSENDPICDGSDEEVLGPTFCESGYEVEHAIRNHFLAFGYIFIFFNCIRHYFNVIYDS